MAKIYRSARARLTLTACSVALLATPLASAEISLDVTGGNGDLEAAMRSASLLMSPETEDVTDPQELVAAAQSDYRRLLAALYDRGLFSGAVSIAVDGREAADLSPLRAPDGIDRIAISVDPGPQFTFSEAVVAPLPDPMPEDSELPEGFAAGEDAGTGLMRRAAQAGVDAWQQAGHARARVDSQEITAFHERQQVAARFGIAPGPLLRFGDTVLSQRSGNSAVRPERIAAIAGIPEGEVYDPDAITRAEQRLRQTGAFRSATIEEAGQAGADDTLDMIVDVEDAAPRRFGFGAELSSTEGLTLNSYWMHRNLTGAADRLRIDGTVSGIGVAGDGIDYTLAATLTRPAFRHPDNQLRYGISLEHEDEPTYRSDVAEFTIGVDRYVNEDLTVSTELGYRYASASDDFGNRDFQHGFLTAGAVFDNRDSSTNPTEGYYANVALTPFAGLSGSSSGVRATGDLRTYAGFASDRFVIAGRMQFGAVGPASIEDLPPDYLFYSGGGGTVRGQGYQSLGVTLPSGEETGGRSFAAASLELRAKVTDTIGVVGFIDYGYVAAGTNFSGGDDHAGAGIGARYYTSLGPVRLDVAVPLEDNINSVSLYIGIGQAF